MQIAGADEELTSMVSLVADCFFFCMAGCMLGQQQYEINYIKENDKVNDIKFDKVAQFLPPGQQEMHPLNKKA